MKSIIKWFDYIVYGSDVMAAVRAIEAKGRHVTKIDKVRLRRLICDLKLGGCWQKFDSLWLADEKVYDINLRHPERPSPSGDSQP
jgi:hypothetical protein